jgi:hypothetical protein
VLRRAAARAAAAAAVVKLVARLLRLCILAEPVVGATGEAVAGK